MNDLLIVPQIENKPTAISPEAEAKKKEIMARSALVIQVTNPAELQICVGQSQEIQRLLNEADGSVEFAYRPFKNICDWISSKGKEYKLRLLDEKARLKKLMDHFAAQEAARVEAEQRKLDEARQKAEREAAAAIAEQERQAREAAEKIAAENRRIEGERVEKERKLAAAIEEQKRLEGMKRQSAEKKAAAEKAIADAQAELEKANAKKAQSVPNIAQEIAAEVKVQAAVENLHKIQTAVAPQAAKAAGYGAKKVVKHEITDAAALYAVRPEWFELVPKKSIMNASILETTNLPGLKVWTAVETQTRS
jgi:chromosome segregation ATPase